MIRGPAPPRRAPVRRDPNDEYNSNWGRWLTPDPAGKKAVRLDDPQTWNAYAYVRNNPTTLTDPSGLLTPAGGVDLFESSHVYTGTIESFDQGTEERPAGEQAQNNSTQQPALVPLSSDVHYTVANNGPNSPEVHPVFSPETAAHLNAAFSELNKDGITPQINSAFRTNSDQAYMQSGGSGTNPAAKVSCTRPEPP